MKQLYSELRKVESEEILLPLAAKLALLEQNYKECLALSKRWVEESPLNPDAIRTSNDAIRPPVW